MEAAASMVWSYWVEFYKYCRWGFYLILLLFSMPSDSAFRLADREADKQIEKCHRMLYEANSRAAPAYHIN